jgi:DNA repair exonuclease SbcCD ATPase subunit
MSKVVRDKETNEDIILDPEKDLNIVLPGYKCHAYISIFEDAINQLAVLADVVPLGFQGTSKDTDKISKVLKNRKIMNFNEDKENENISQMNLANNMIKIQNERNFIHSLFSKTINELKENKFQSLVRTVIDEYDKKNRYKNTINKANEASELLKDLQAKLSNEKILLEEETNERNQVIQQLKDTIQEITTLTASEQKYIKKETKANEASVKGICQKEESALLEKKHLLQKKIEQEQMAHERIVEFLERQRGELEKQIEEWMQKYERDIEDKCQQIQDVQGQLEKDTEEFESLSQRYEELEAKVQEDREQQQQLEYQQKLNELRTEAASKIQKWWRRIFRNKKSKVKTSKKGKSGKKKGKKGDGKKKGSIK